MDRVFTYPFSDMSEEAIPEGTPLESAPHIARVLAENLESLMKAGANKKLKNNILLSKKTGIGTGTFSRIRNGQVSVTLETLVKIATAFDVEPWQLLVQGIDPTNPPVLRSSGESEEEFYKRMKHFAEERLAKTGEDR